MATVAKISVLVAMAAALAACGSRSDIEGRTLGGAGVGASAVTNEQAIDLGDPVWKRR